MMLESAAVAVGKALGNQLAHAWLAGRAGEQERRSELSELIQVRFPDRIARRRFERQVADIADQVAERLLGVCGHEYGGLGENDKAAALAEVVRTLAEADLSDRALFAADVDPMRLAARIRSGLPRRAVTAPRGEPGVRPAGVQTGEAGAGRAGVQAGDAGVRPPRIQVGDASVGLPGAQVGEAGAGRAGAQPGEAGAGRAGVQAGDAGVPPAGAQVGEAGARPGGAQVGQAGAPQAMEVQLGEAGARRAMEMQLGEAGARLYDVVLDECCDCFVRIVRQLPQFGPRASAEALARLSGVSEQVALLLARLPARTLDAPEGTATDEVFRRRYLEHLSVTLDVLELFGVRVERYRPRTTLSIAYISLSVSTGERPARHGAGTGAGALDLDDWRSGEREPGEATLRVEAALARAPLTLLRGEAGSGKSTLLRWLAISAARGTFGGELADWNGRVPFLIKLRSHSGRTLPPPERFLDGVADPVAGLMPAGWVHRRLRDGRVLLMVDGVDELPGAQRRAVRPWLAGLIAEYPDLRVVVTSRPAAAGGDWLAAEGFATALLERMTHADIKELIRHWHDAVRDAGDLPCPPEQLPGFEAALLARMESAPHLRALAGSPLLAAMLCALNLDRERQLPRDRMGLYAAALELLLERRDVERRITDEVTLERAQKLGILQDLAWRLSITGRTELPKDAVVRRTAEKLGAMPSAPGDAGAVLDHLLHRSGVLREPVPGRVDFVHRTVQEYLTAKQCADDGDLEPLVAQAHKDQWRETVIMAAGHANAPQRAELLSGLLQRIRTEPRHARRLKLLVAGCLETLPAIPGELRSDVEACLDDLVPPRDLAAARSLSNAGETVLDRLPRTPEGLTAAAARAVVRTAWLVNGPRALDLLAGYAADPRREVQEELVKGWEYFDADLYARRVLADAPLLDGHLNLPVPRLAHAARHLRRLRSCHVEDAPDLSFLRRFGQALTRISARRVRSGDLTPLTAHAASLVHLSITTADPAVPDLTPLFQLRALESLVVNVDGLTDLSFVKDLPALILLHLTGLTAVTDLSPVRDMGSLASLGLSDCAALTDVRDLPVLGSLTELRLLNSGLSVGLEKLAERVPRITNLHLNGSTSLADLGQLVDLELESLGLWSCRAITDFTPLADMRALNWLDLEDTAIGDLTALAGLAELETLWLRNCENVTDLTPLGGLAELKYLYLTGVAPGTDLAPLAGGRATVYIERSQNVRNRRALGRRLQAD